MEMLHIDSISLGTGAQVAGKVSFWRVEVIKWLIYHPKEMLKGNFRVYGPKFCMDAHPSGSYWGLIYYIYIDVFIPQGMFVTRSSYSDRRLGQKSCTLLAMGADFASRPDSATFDSFHSQILLIFMFGHVLTLFQWNSVSISFWFDSDRSSIFPGWGLLICLHCYLQLSIRILRTIPKVTFLQILAQYSYWDRLLWPVGACMISYKICMHIMYIIYV